MKIVSLLPSATEIIYSLGLSGELAAVTHECDFPPESTQLPAITSSRISHEKMSSREIDHAVRSQLDGHGTIYDLDNELLEKIAPDLVITQELCEVCAVSYKILKRAARVLKADTTLISLEPNTIEDVFDTILTVGEAANVEERARTLVNDLTERLLAIKNKFCGVAAERPRVMMLEWLDPPFSPGHWVPEQVDAAGGFPVMGQPGSRSEVADYQAISDADPEILVFIPCGYYIKDIVRQLGSVVFPASWRSMKAIEKGNVWAVDATSYFSRPGPRIVDGVEILAKIFHPELFGEPGPHEAFRVPADGIVFEKNL